MIRLSSEESVNVIAVCIASWMLRTSESCLQYRTVVLTLTVTSVVFVYRTGHLISERSFSLNSWPWTVMTESHLKHKILFISSKGICHNVCYACRNTTAADASFNTTLRVWISPRAWMFVYFVIIVSTLTNFERSTHSLILTAEESWEVISRIRGKLGT